jgi:hypothetical protein
LGSGTTATCGYVVDITGYITAPGTGSSASLLASTYRIAQTVDNAKPNFKTKLSSSGTVPSAANTSTIQISAWGQGNIPNTATGIIGVLTNVGCNAGGNFRFWTGASVPDASNLNVPGAFPALNLSTNFVAPLDATGKVYLGLGSGATNMCGFVVDIVGYLSPSGTGNDFNLLSSSVRVATTQDNSSPKLSASGVVPSLGNNSTIQFTLGGSNNIPSGAKGVVGVLTNVGCNAGGNFRFWTGATVPDASNLNVPGANAALNIGTGFIAPLDATGKVYLGLGSGTTTTCGYVVDLVGYIK